MTSPEDVSFPSSVASSRQELVSTNREVADPGDKDEEGIQGKHHFCPIFYVVDILLSRAS